MAVFALTLACGSVVRADVPVIGTAATASTPAERILVTGPGVFFPMNPVPKCDVLNNFGGMSKQFGSGGHQGVDIGATLGQEVYAVEDGVLTRQLTDLSSAPGNAWIFVGNTDTQYRYYHLSAFAPGLTVGSTVRQGDVIGYVGDSPCTVFIVTRGVMEYLDEQGDVVQRDTTETLRESYLRYCKDNGLEPVDLDG
ncbi:MAG TPA: M23 family metallopeptidase [Ilumatobacter sp.]|nr:M23 family metallopeptidase [Ilumatobacter sp.]